MLPEISCKKNPPEKEDLLMTVLRPEDFLSVIF